MPALLAFDTATEQMSIGLQVGDARWVHEAGGGAQASAALIPAILALLSQAGIGLKQLDAIGFGRGPGAFTGLRTACSVAQGLAFGAGLPVLALDTLMAVAETARMGTSTGTNTGTTASAAPHRCGVAIDARMNEIYAATYGWDGNAWQTLSAPSLGGVDALRAAWQAAPWQAGDVVAGNALTAFPVLDAGAAHRAPAAWPSAAALLQLAQAQWASGETLDPALALPVYVRDKVAQTTEERAAVQALKDASNLAGTHA